MKTFLFYTVGLFFLLHTSMLVAQDFNIIQDSAYYKVETKDGNIYAGQIVEHADTYLKLQTESIGIIQLAKIDISKIRELNKKDLSDKNSRWFDYLQSSRYFYSPSGYGLKKGDAYYQNVWIMFNQFAMGVTDHLSVGFGLIPLFLFAGTATPVWVTPKVSLPIVRDKFNVGAGGLFGGVIGEDEASFGIVYGSATVGRRELNLSFGLGYGYYNDSDEGELVWAKRPTFSISGMAKAGDKFYFVTENYIFDEVGLFAVGGRSLIRSVTLDYGLVMPSDTGGEFIALPWLGLVVPIETAWGR